MANPNANDAAVDPDLDTRFSHLTMSAPPVDDAATAPNTDTPSFWLTQDASFPFQPTITHQGTIDPPPLTDSILAAQINAQHPSFDYEQYTGYPTNQPYWNPDNDPAQAGPSSAPADLNRPFVCDHKGCGKAYRRQCDLDKHKNNHKKPRQCEICGVGGAETKDLNRHMWTNHPDEARVRGVPKDEDHCPKCQYTGRSDNVKRHKDKKGHWD